METLVVLSQHKNQYYSRAKSHRLDHFESRYSGELNCRAFYSRSGILPTPLRSNSISATKQTGSSRSPSLSSSPPTSPNPSPSTSPTFNSPSFNQTFAKATTPQSCPIPIHGNSSKKENNPFEGVGNRNGSFYYSELWAGPAYSNSPPPSSVPFPKFSVRPKRTVSLTLPSSDPFVDLLPLAKSAPPSPTRGHAPSAIELLLSADSATKTLRRILNLDGEAD